MKSYRSMILVPLMFCCCATFGSEEEHIQTGDVLDAIWRSAGMNEHEICDLAEHLEQVCPARQSLQKCVERVSNSILICRNILIEFYTPELPYKRPITENNWFEPITKAATVCPAVIELGCKFQMTEEGHKIIAGIEEK